MTPEDLARIAALMIMLQRLLMFAIVVSNFHHQSRNRVNWGWVINIGMAWYIGYLSGIPFVREEFSLWRVVGAYAVLTVVYGLSSYAKRADLRGMRKVKT
jgi:hypothetical protein